MMTDGTIEEDFEKALAREVALAGEVGSPETPVVTSKIFEGDMIMEVRVECVYKMVISDVSIEDFSDLAEHGIVDVVGDDKGGRKIIVVSACKLPPNKDFDNQRFLRFIHKLIHVRILLSLFRYLMTTLDQYVDMDYSLVYFHHGLTSRNKPPLSWLWGLYKVLSDV